MHVTATELYLIAMVVIMPVFFLSTGLRTSW